VHQRCQHLSNYPSRLAQPLLARPKERAASPTDIGVWSAAAKTCQRALVWPANCGVAPYGHGYVAEVGGD